MNSSILYKSLPARLILHLAFWGLSYYILVHVFASSSEIQPTDHIYTAVFVLIIAIGVYINLYLLIPLFLNKGKVLLIWNITDLLYYRKHVSESIDI